MPHQEAPFSISIGLAVATVSTSASTTKKGDQYRVRVSHREVPYAYHPMKNYHSRQQRSQQQQLNHDHESNLEQEQKMPQTQLPQEEFQEYGGDYHYDDEQDSFEDDNELQKQLQQQQRALEQNNLRSNYQPSHYSSQRRGLRSLTTTQTILAATTQSAAAATASVIGVAHVVSASAQQQQRTTKSTKYKAQSVRLEQHRVRASQRTVPYPDHHPMNVYTQQQQQRTYQGDAMPQQKQEHHQNKQDNDKQRRRRAAMPPNGTSSDAAISNSASNDVKVLFPAKTELSSSNYVDPAQHSSNSNFSVSSNNSFNVSSNNNFNVSSNNSINESLSSHNTSLIENDFSSSINTLSPPGMSTMTTSMNVSNMITTQNLWTTSVSETPVDIPSLLNLTEGSTSLGNSSSPSDTNDTQTSSPTVESSPLPFERIEPEQQPIRITAVLSTLPGSNGQYLTSTERNTLLNDILNPALNVWSRALRVTPVSGKLIVDRDQLYDGQSCGPGIDLEDRGTWSGSPLVPEEHLVEGANETDLMLYLSLSFFGGEEEEVKWAVEKDYLEVKSSNDVDEGAVIDEDDYLEVKWNETVVTNSSSISGLANDTALLHLNGTGSNSSSFINETAQVKNDGMLLDMNATNATNATQQLVLNNTAQHGNSSIFTASLGNTTDVWTNQTINASINETTVTVNNSTTASPSVEEDISNTTAASSAVEETTSNTTAASSSMDEAISSAIASVPINETDANELEIKSNSTINPLKGTNEPEETTTEPTATVIINEEVALPKPDEGSSETYFYGSQVPQDSMSIGELEQKIQHAESQEMINNSHEQSPTPVNDDTAIHQNPIKNYDRHDLHDKISETVIHSFRAEDGMQMVSRVSTLKNDAPLYVGEILNADTGNTLADEGEWIHDEDGNLSYQESNEHTAQQHQFDQGVVDVDGVEEEIVDNVMVQDVEALQEQDEDAAAVNSASSNAKDQDGRNGEILILPEEAAYSRNNTSPNNEQVDSYAEFNSTANDQSNMTQSLAPTPTGSTTSTTASTAHVTSTSNSPTAANHDPPPQCYDPSILASATYCSTDQFDRPIAGTLHLCIDRQTFFSEAYRQKAITTILHEIGHVLGMNPLSMAHFRERDGKPQTERDEDGNVEDVEVECAGGFEQDAGVRMEVPLPSENTVRFRRTRGGRRVAEIVTPNVAQLVRNQFDCQTLPGAELQSDTFFSPPYSFDVDDHRDTNDQAAANLGITPSSCIGDHWSRRLFKTDLMNPILDDVTFSYRISPLTLAYFFDSGWYSLDYSRASVLAGWGKGAGCEFVQETCIDPSTSEISESNTPFFCNRPLSSPSEIHEIHGCTDDSSRKAVCSLVEYDSDLASPFQYFAGDGGYRNGLGANWGGSDPEMEYCPTYRGFVNGLCTDEENAETLKIHRMEEFGVKNSRCVVTNYRKRNTALCIPIACVVSDHSLRIKVDGYWKICDYAGKRIELWWDDRDYVICPDPISICPTFYCPRNCLGTDGGVCDYSTGMCMCDGGSNGHNVLGGEWTYDNGGSGGGGGQSSSTKVCEVMGNFGGGDGLDYKYQVGGDFIQSIYVEKPDLLRNEKKSILDLTHRAFVRMNTPEIVSFIIAGIIILCIALYCFYRLCRILHHKRLIHRKANKDKLIASMLVHLRVHSPRNRRRRSGRRDADGLDGKKRKRRRRRKGGLSKAACREVEEIPRNQRRRHRRLRSLEANPALSLPDDEHGNQNDDDYDLESSLSLTSLHRATTVTTVGMQDDVDGCTSRSLRMFDSFSDYGAPTNSVVDDDLLPSTRDEEEPNIAENHSGTCDKIQNAEVNEEERSNSGNNPNCSVHRRNVTKRSSIINKNRERIKTD